MNKKLLSGLVALSMVASMGAMAADAVKLGNINNDENIDIEDAVAVINHVNGVKALTADQEKIADVDKSGNVDIEDAVRIINHINGITPLPDEDVVTDAETTAAEDSSKAEESSKPDESSAPNSQADSSKPDESSSNDSRADSSAADDSSEPEAETVTITLKNDDRAFTLKKGETIPQKYGKFPVADDESTWDNESWYHILTDGSYMGEDGFVYVNVISSIKDTKTGAELQDYIANAVPVTEDTEFEIITAYKALDVQLDEGQYLITVYNDSADGDDVFSFGASGYDGTLLHTDKSPMDINVKTEVKPGGSYSFIYQFNEPTYDKKAGSVILSNLPSDREGSVYSHIVTPYSQCDENYHVDYHCAFPKVYGEGERTYDFFKKMSDGNYYLDFSGSGIILDRNTAISVNIKQVSPKVSRAKVSMPGRGVNSDIVIKDDKTYKIVDEENKKFTAKLSTAEKMMDFNAIFSSMLGNDSLNFVRQTEDTENNQVTEYYTAVITQPANANVFIEATYDKPTAKMKKLVMYTDDYEDEDLETTVYLSTDMILFEPVYQAPRGLIPDFSDWEKVKLS